MNIQEAKQEMKHTVRAYLHKDEEGRYHFPVVRQRPILLMGPPGIGKTAIMEQLAEEMGIGLVAYTMTHHTRQSAVGLPQICEQVYGEEMHSVTRYTMSEIIASVYDMMNRTGCTEGILFLDEINCVSDTLAPTMLQFLQNKTFGTHKLPEGWIIAAAGNPPEYNKSVREFDIVTLDRIRTIDITPDTEAFLRYAAERNLHGAVQSYLKLHPERFYHVSRQEERKYYVTARGWEDLSALLQSYEELDLPLSEEIFSEFLCLPEISREFYAYYRLYRKYGSDYCIPSILNGELSESEVMVLTKRLQRADFVERFAVTEMLLHGIKQTAAAYRRSDEMTELLHEALKACLTQEHDLREYTAKRREAVATKKKFGFLKETELMKEEALLNLLDAGILEMQEHSASLVLQKEVTEEKQEQFRQILTRQLLLREREIRRTSSALQNGIDWMQKALGQGQELTALLNGLSAEPTVMHFIAQHGCEAYLRECGCLQITVQEEELQRLLQERININQLLIKSQVNE